MLPTLLAASALLIAGLILLAVSIALLLLKVHGALLTAIDFAGFVTETLVDLRHLAFLLQIRFLEPERVATLFRGDRASARAAVIALDLAVMCQLSFLRTSLQRARIDPAATKRRN